jgi:choline dehydrogenase-like flavoprotein
MDTDVCIVGAGAAGGIMALELARRGVAVAVLESGPRHELAARRDYVRRYLRHENPWASRLPDLDRATFGGRLAYTLEGRRVRGVGGSTLAWEGYALRFHANDFRLRSLYGVADDWPIEYADLEPYYTRAEAALGVAGTADDPSASRRSAPFPLPPFPFSYSDGIFGPACARLGIQMRHLPQARNSVAYGGRAPCQACSTCHVCPTGAKATVDLTHIAAAEATHRVRLVTDASVLRLATGPSDEVTYAVYALRDRVERRLTARIFVLAAGSVENVRLLLRSASTDAPAGLGNGSGMVGKRFMSQSSVDVVGQVRDSAYPHRIGFSTAMSRQFADDAQRPSRAGFVLEFLNSAGPRPDQLAAGSGLTGDAQRRHVQQQFGKQLGIRVYAEHLPDRVNTVSLDRRVSDYFGAPVPRIEYRLAPYDRGGLTAGTQMAKKILEAAGATDVRMTMLSPSAHQLGTHRMGVDPASSVTDHALRAHDVSNLYLVGGGSFVTSTPAPPTLTIAALALRAAEHIAGVLRPGTPG